MSTSSDGKTRSGGTPLSSEAAAGDIVEEARAKMQESIINVNQFYPEISGGIRIYRDKFSFLADNRPDIPEDEEEEKEEKEEETEEKKEEEQETKDEAKDEKEKEKEKEKKEEDQETKIEVNEEEQEKEKEKEEEKSTGEEDEKDHSEERASKREEEKDMEKESVEGESPKAIEEEDGEEKEEEENASAGKAEGNASVFTTELGTDPPDSQGGATNLLFLPEHWSSRGYDLSSLRGVIANSTAEHYKAGQVATKLQRYDTALGHFNKCVKLQPHEAVYYVRRGEIFLTLCDFASAILNYKRACILEPTNRDHFQRLAFLYLLHGQSLFDQKLYPEALEHFSRAAEMQPDRIAYQTRNLACLAALQRHGECLALVNKRLELDASSADLYVMRARLHSMFRNYSLCYYDLKDALSIDAGHAQALAMLAELAEKAQEFNARSVELALSGRTREALNRVSLAIEMDPTVAAFHVKRGAFQRRLGDFNAAIDDFLLALDKADHDEGSPIYAEAQRQLLLTFNDFAVECFAKGYYEEAIVLLNKAIKAEKKERGLYINRGDCFYRQGEMQFALADFHQALELEVDTDADLTLVHARIALVHHRLGQDAFTGRKALDEAEERFSLAIRHNPSVAHFWMARARVRYTMDRASEGARRDVVAALLLRPTGAHADEPPDDGSMSLVTRLFPGQTLSEVINSPLALAARTDLERVVREVFPAAEVTLTGDPHGATAAAGSGYSRLRVRRSRRGRRQTRSRAMPSLRECISDKALYVELVEEKRALAAKVKERQRQRQSLKAGPGRVLPMTGPSELVRRGGVAGDHLQKEELLNDKGQVVGREGEVKGWRQFSLGVGTQ